LAVGLFEFHELRKTVILMFREEALRPFEKRVTINDDFLGLFGAIHVVSLAGVNQVALGLWWFHASR
jgi:hypothetical protein